MKKLAAFLVLFIFLCGCDGQELKFKTFEPTSLSPDMKVFQKDNLTYVEYQSKKYKVTVSLFEYQNFFIAPVEIDNLTNSDIATREYSIGLFDGRDYLPIKMLPIENLRSIQAGLNGGSPAFSYDSPEKALQTAVASILEKVQPSSKKAAAEGLERLIGEYYAFRPVYANETRKGLLAFLLDFPLEYPLSVIVKLKGERIDFHFMPSTEGVPID